MSVYNKIFKLIVLLGFLGLCFIGNLIQKDPKLLQTVREINIDSFNLAKSCQGQFEEKLPLEKTTSYIVNPIKRHESVKKETVTTDLFTAATQTSKFDFPDSNKEDTPLTENSNIKYKVTNEIRMMNLFQTFEQRKIMHSYACQHSRKVFDKELTHKQRINLQEQIRHGKVIPDEKQCIPMLAREGFPENHFYDDKHKYHVCLPTKTGSTNWLRMLFSLYKYAGYKDPDTIDKSQIYHRPQMPRFSKKLAEFKKSRNPKNDYFTMISVRHPLGRLYSAWKDKFRNDHLWWKAIKSKFGDMLYELERKNMTDEPYEVSFEAFLELVALSKFDSDRDRHWKSIQGYCGSCNFEYDFILKQETAPFENEFLTKVLQFDKTHPALHVPNLSTVRKVELTQAADIEEIIKPYRNISRKVIKDLYANYYPDFVFFNYSIDPFYDGSRNNDSESILESREKVRTLFSKGSFAYYQKRSDDMTCDGEYSFNCKFGIWRKMVNKTLGGVAPEYGDKKFQTLLDAQKYACDKDEIKGITYTEEKFSIRGGSTGLRDSIRGETTWIKQFAEVTFAK